MPFCDVAQQMEYWATNPPLHLAVLAYLGYEKPRKMEFDDAMKVMPMLSRQARAASLSQAPERIRLMAESVKKIKHG